MQVSPSPQSRAEPTQEPELLHVSPTVQKAPSLQLTPVRGDQLVTLALVLQI